MRSIATKVAGLTVAAGMLVAATNLHATPEVYVNECTVTPAGSVMVKEGEQAVKITVSEALPAGATASFPAESNIKVLGLAGTEEPNAHELKVDASAAAPGKYAITIKAGEASCSGEVTVAAPEADSETR